jgi:hypothetical protein
MLVRARCACAVVCCLVCERAESYVCDTRLQSKGKVNGRRGIDSAGFGRRKRARSVGSSKQPSALSSRGHHTAAKKHRSAFNSGRQKSQRAHSNHR